MPRLIRAIRSVVCHTLMAISFLVFMTAAAHDVIEGGPGVLILVGIGIGIATVAMIAHP